MGATEKLYQAIPSIRFNPSVVTRYTLAMVEEKLNGKFDLVDATNPFIMLLEGSSTLASAACTDGEVILRRMYESLAVTEEELYLHMSDRDYLNRFAGPSKAPFSLFFLLDDIIRYAQPSPTGNYRRLVIPKHTQLTALGIPFTMQYGIEIRIQPHGGIDVVWMSDEQSPIERLTSNIVEKKFSQLLVGETEPERKEFLRLNFSLSQFLIQSNKETLNNATTFRKTYAFVDQFYYARAYVTNGTSQWTEIRTTHTQQVFDPNYPTVLLRVVGNTLTVELPQVYSTNNLVTGEIRIDIYTTRGSMDIDLSNLASEAYAYQWRDLDGSVDSRFYSPLSGMTMSMFSTGSAIGGHDKLSFDDLRERVMSNAVGDVKIPITNVQTTTYLQDRGYSVVTDVDNVTNREFLATRLLPIPTEGPVVSSAGLAMQTLAATFNDLINYDTIKDNGPRLTILPDTLYTADTGVTEIVPKVVVDSIMALSNEERADRINQERFMYSPFHYVLDTTSNKFETRAYYLDQPSITDRNFIAANSTTGISVGTQRFSIEKNANGYLLSIQALGDDEWDALDDNDVFCQLGFIPDGEIDYAYLNGTLAGMYDGSRVYQFQIDTNYDVTSTDALGITSFSMYGDGPRTHFGSLKSKFVVIYGASGLTDPSITPSTIDLDLNTTNLPNNSIGLTEESFEIVLGYSLQGLWTSSRSVPSSLDYLRHLTDVPAVYKENVYERDATGAKKWEIVNGKIEFVILHHAGDQIYDEFGEPVYEARVGDVVLDNDGQPVIQQNRNMLRQTDILMVDGLYYFATESSSVAYKKSIAKLVTEWISTDIADASRVLLEQSHLYFYPQVTFGHVDALVADNKQLRVRADQKFTVTYYVTGSVYRDLDLRINMTVAGRTAINEVLQGSVVTSDDLIETVANKVRGDAIAVTVTGLGGTTPYDAVTLLDDSARLSIAKRAIAYADGTIGIEDAVDTVFVHHSD